MNLKQEQDPVAHFLKANRREVPDNGFTERVMHRLPRRYERIALTIRVVGAVAVIVLFFCLGGVELVTGYCENIWSSLKAHDWDNAQLQSFSVVIAGLVIAGICNLSLQKD